MNPVAIVIQEPPHFLGVKFAYPGACVPGQKLYARPSALDEAIKGIRGVRVENDSVIISVRGGNDAARELCAKLLAEMDYWRSVDERNT
jgi:hypothetical protein